MTGVKRAWAIAWRGGAALGLFEVLYGLFFRLADLHYASAWTWGFYLALPVGVYLAHRFFKRRNEGTMSFKVGMGIAAPVVGIGSAAYCTFVYVYNRFIDDSLLQAIFNDRIRELETQGANAAAMEAATRSLEAFTQPGTFSLSVFAQLVVIGLMAALVVATFTRRSQKPQGG